MTLPPKLGWAHSKRIDLEIAKFGEKNPFMALMVAALHGAPVDYDRTHPYVEHLTKLGPKQLLDPDRVRKILKSSIPHEYWSMTYAGSTKGVNDRAVVVSKMAKCYLANREVGFNEFMSALTCVHPIYFTKFHTKRKRHVSGIGRKSAQLGILFLGR